METIKITDESMEKVEDDIETDGSCFGLGNMITVRVPFTGYYELEINCDDAQIAMIEVLKMNRMIGLGSIEDVGEIIDEIDEDETYCVIRE